MFYVLEQLSWINCSWLRVSEILNFKDPECDILCLVNDSDKYFYEKHVNPTECLCLFISKASGKLNLQKNRVIWVKCPLWFKKIISFPVVLKTMVTPWLGSNEVRFYFYKESDDFQAPFWRSTGDKQNFQLGLKKDKSKIYIFRLLCQSLLLNLCQQFN